MNLRKIHGALLCGILIVSCAGCATLFKKRKAAIEPISAEQKVIVPEPVTLPAPSGEFIPGERFDYEVRWLGLDVGDAALSVTEKKTIDDREVYHLVMTAATNRFFSFFYKVDGVIESYIDAETFLPIRYESRTLLNRKNVIKKMRYDFVFKKVFAEDKKGKYEIDIPDNALDPMGIFYYFRTHQVIVDGPIELTINGGKKNFPVTVFTEDHRKIHTPAGSFHAFMVKPTQKSERQFDDALNAPGSMSVWFSADDKRIPLLITLKVPLGTAQAILVSVHIPDKPVPETEMLPVSLGTALPVTPAAPETPAPPTTPDTAKTTPPAAVPETTITPGPVITPQPVVTTPPAAVPETTITPVPLITPEPAVTDKPLPAPEPVLTPGPTAASETKLPVQPAEVPESPVVPQPAADAPPEPKTDGKPPSAN